MEKRLRDSIPVNTNLENIDTVKLLDIWEEDGLDAAVLAWKEMSKKKKPNSPNKKTNAQSRSFQNTSL